MAGEKKIKLTLAKGVARTRKDHRETVRGLGLKWTNHSVEIIDKQGNVLKTLSGPKEDVARGIFEVIEERLVRFATKQ